MWTPLDMKTRDRELNRLIDNLVRRGDLRKNEPGLANVVRSIKSARKRFRLPPWKVLISYGETVAATHRRPVTRLLFQSEKVSG